MRTGTKIGPIGVVLFLEFLWLVGTVLNRI